MCSMRVTTVVQDHSAGARPATREGFVMGIRSKILLAAGAALAAVMVGGPAAQAASPMRATPSAAALQVYRAEVYKTFTTTWGGTTVSCTIQGSSYYEYPVSDADGNGDGYTHLHATTGLYGDPTGECAQLIGYTRAGLSWRAEGDSKTASAQAPNLYGPFALVRRVGTDCRRTCARQAHGDLHRGPRRCLCAARAVVHHSAQVRDDAQAEADGSGVPDDTTSAGRVSASCAEGFIEPHPQFLPGGPSAW